MNSGSWDIYYQIKDNRKRLLNKYWELATFYPKIEKLYHLKSEKARKKAYEELCALNPKLFSEAKRFFNAIQNHASDEGHRDVYDWVMTHDKDPLSWKDLFSHQTFVSTLKQFVTKHQARRKKELTKNTYLPWDHWYEPKQANKSHVMQKIMGFKASVNLVKEFYNDLGFEDIITQITFIKKKKSPTNANILYYQNKWSTNVALSEEGSGSPVGSIYYLKTITHEIGHIIQVRLNNQPTNADFLANYTLIEVVAIFFELLFMHSAFLKEKLKRHNKHTLDLKQYQLDVQEDMIRQLYLLDVEIAIYEMIANNKFNAKNIAKINQHKRKQYYGFEDYNLSDHSWQRCLNYYAYSPFKLRTYVIAMILARHMYEHYLELTHHKLGTKKANTILKEILIACSHKGSKNTWQDYFKASGIKKKASTQFFVKSISEILQGH